jgi:hypothetical protein
VDDLELLAVRANAPTNGLRVLEPSPAIKGKIKGFVLMHFANSM